MPELEPGIWEFLNSSFPWFFNSVFEEHPLSVRDFRKKQAHIPVAREGIPYILAAIFATLITAVVGWGVVTVLLLAATLMIGHFFRDPERVSAASENDVISPADGCII